MTADTLRGRLQGSAARLDAISTLLGTRTGKLVGTAGALFEEAASGAAGLRGAEGLLAHREACWNALVAVRDGSDASTDRSRLNGHEMNFEYARYLTTQAYLASHWSLADQITRAAGRILCTEGPVKNAAKTPNLWQHFMKNGESAPWLTVHVLKECYGWPIGVSYIVRNHFTHEGGVGDGWGFFESSAVADGFIVSDNAWRYLIDKAKKEYKVRPEQARCASIDPMGKRKLDEILALCHAEMDDALGVLILSASALAEAYAGVLHE
ncbi:hypothetical protein L6R53_01705 [Myxococcota bacterium]|nr:hypothetical protein [Myxococcota bacterium]